jgi:hypothetical protein
MNKLFYFEKRNSASLAAISSQELIIQASLGSILVRHGVPTFIEGVQNYDVPSVILGTGMVAGGVVGLKFAVDAGRAAMNNYQAYRAFHVAQVEVPIYTLGQPPAALTVAV